MRSGYGRAPTLGMSERWVSRHFPSWINDYLSTGHISAQHRFGEKPQRKFRPSLNTSCSISAPLHVQLPLLSWVAGAMQRCWGRSAPPTLPKQQPEPQNSRTFLNFSIIYHKHFGMKPAPMLFLSFSREVHLNFSEENSPGLFLSSQVPLLY